ncbi:MAG: hypothetical protein Q8O56_05760 [Solirubrobacteraceae bacterium]|nr:hypothetical protein [Solirubrobacteraceae bacterium]
MLVDDADASGGRHVCEAPAIGAQLCDPRRGDDAHRSDVAQRRLGPRVADPERECRAEGYRQQHTGRPAAEGASRDGPHTGYNVPHGRTILSSPGPY